MRRTPKILVTLFLLTFTACAEIDKAMTGSSTAPSQSDRQFSVTQFPNLSEEEKGKYIQGIPWIGMEESTLNKMWGNEPFRTQAKIIAKGNQKTSLYKIRDGNWKTGINTKLYKVIFLNGRISELTELDPNVGSYDNI